MTKPYSAAFKKKMVQRLTGKDAISATQLAQETGLRQQNLSKWLREARSVPFVASDSSDVRPWSVEHKARILAEGSKLTGQQLTAYLEREGVQLADYETWRRSLEEGTKVPVAAARRIRNLERELARKEKALAEAAALLVLKKKLEAYYQAVGDDDTDEDSET